MTSIINFRDQFFGPRVFDSILEDFFYDLDRTVGEWKNDLEEAFPQYRCKSSDSEKTFQLSLAGYAIENLEVGVEGNTIYVKSKKVDNEEHLFAGRAFTWKQRDPYNAWALDQSKITFKNGLLTIKIPKRESAKVKQLQIESI